MSLWGNVDQANNKPKYANTANTFGVNAAEATVAGGRVPHAGWVDVKLGTGPVTALAIADGGADYAEDEVLIFTGGAGTGAAGIISAVDGNGAITAVTLTSGGSGYTSAPTVSANTVAGTGLDITATVGGRSGRTFFEVLVAMGSISSDASDDATFPDA